MALRELIYSVQRTKAVMLAKGLLSIFASGCDCQTEIRFNIGLTIYAWSLNFTSGTKYLYCKHTQIQEEPLIQCICDECTTWKLSAAYTGMVLSSNADTGAGPWRSNIPVVELYCIFTTGKTHKLHPEIQKTLSARRVQWLHMLTTLRDPTVCWLTRRLSSLRCWMLLRVEQDDLAVHDHLWAWQMQ